MIFLSEFIEWIACLTEVGLFYWLAGKTFREERKNVRIYWDYILSVILAVVILGLNNIVLYSSFTLFFWMLFGSVSAMALYRVSYIKLLSLTALYLVFLLHRYAGIKSVFVCRKPLQYKRRYNHDILLTENRTGGLGKVRNDCFCGFFEKTDYPAYPE